MKSNTRKKATKPATVAKSKTRRTSTRPGGIDLLRIADAVRVPDVKPGQDRESGLTATLLDKAVPPGRKEEEEKTLRFIFGNEAEQDKKLVVQVVHVNDRGERIEPTEKEREEDKKIEGRHEKD